MPQKMLSCICGNTELEKVGVNLLRTNDAESLELVALLCRGNGCGRVTFRPSDMTKTKQESANPNRELMKQVILLFEQIYTERLVYKVIAERDPGCQALVEALKADREIREGITRTFTPIFEAIERNQEFIKALQSLPSTGAKKQSMVAVAHAAE